MSEDKKALVSAKSKGLEAVINYYFQTKTPKEFILTRPGAGGQIFKYVPIGYVVSQLNIAFGMCWEWKIIDKQVGTKQIWVQGELTIKDFKSGITITRSGMGAANLKFPVKYVNDKKEPNYEAGPISVGNDLKSADSDALKVAAAKFGIGADVKFKEMDILEETPDIVDTDTAESIKRIVMNKFFAIAAERGFTAEKAKDIIKTKYQVAHMEDLTTPQMEEAIKSLEVRYQVVIPGEESLEVGKFRKKPEGLLPTRDISKCALEDCEKDVVKHGFCSEEHHKAYWGKDYKNPEEDPWV